MYGTDTSSEIADRVESAITMYDCKPRLRGGTGSNRNRNRRLPQQDIYNTVKYL